MERSADTDESIEESFMRDLNRSKSLMHVLYLTALRGRCPNLGTWHCYAPATRTRRNFTFMIWKRDRKFTIIKINGITLKCEQFQT